MVAVPFRQIPQNLRIPLFWAEVDPSQANSFEQNQRSLLIGQQLSDAAEASTIVSGAVGTSPGGSPASSTTVNFAPGTPPAGVKIGMYVFDETSPNAVPLGARVTAVGATTVTLSAAASAVAGNILLFADLAPKIVQSVQQAVELYGAGSMLADMVDKYRRNDRFGELWCLGLPDSPSGVAAVGTLILGGAPTEGGVISLYVDGVLVPVIVTTAMSLTEIGEAIESAVNVAVDPFGQNKLPVTANNAVSTVTFTARHKGLAGNDIDIRLNYRGLPSGEKLPAGLDASLTPMAGGAINPSSLLAIVLDNLPDESYDFIGFPYSDAASLNAMQVFLDDVAGRWSWSRQMYGHAFTAARGTVGSLVTLGTSRNDQHTTIMGYWDSPSPSWHWAAALTGCCAASIRADPGLPLHNIPMVGIFAPPVESRFVAGDRNTLVWDGMSVFVVQQDGTVETNLVITTYQLNPSGAPDNSYLKVETMALLWTILRALRERVTSKFSRMKLADNGTRIPAYSSIVTPSIIRADQIAAYRDMIELGWVQADRQFVNAITVQRNGSNPNRVDVIWPGILINQLDVFALLAQFRLLPDQRTAA